MLAGQSERSAAESAATPRKFEPAGTHRAVYSYGVAELMSRREVRLKVDEAVFVARLNELLSQAQNLHVYGVGPQPEANRTFRQQFLAWMAEVERALEWALLTARTSSSGSRRHD